MQNFAVLDSLADAIVVGNLHDRIVYLNPTAERLLGWTCAEAKGESLKILMPVRMHDAHDRGFHRFVTTGQPHIMGRAVRVPALRKDGVEIQIELALSTFRFSDGEPSIIATIRDLSDRVELERHLRISKYLKAANEAAAALTERLDVAHVVRTAAASLVDGFDAALGRVWLCDPERNRLVLRSSAGLSTGIAESSRAVIDLATYPFKVATVAKSRVPLVTNDLSEEKEFDQDWVRREGLRSAAVLPLAVGGELRGVLAAFFRFPLAEEVEEALLTYSALVASALNDSLLHEAERAARQRFEDFVNGFNHGIVWEADARTFAVTFVSSGAERLLGFPVETWTSEPSFLLDHLHADDRARVVATLRDAVERDEDVALEHRLMRADGGFLWVRTGARLARIGPGAGVRLHALSVDVTNIHETMARAEEASRLKDEFLSTVSHELRTPLSAILGWASILVERRGDAASIQRGLEVIERNARSQLRIVEDILDVSRIVRGQLRIETEPLDLEVVVKDVVDSLEPAAAAKQVTIAFRPVLGVHRLIADRERLRQIVWNLVSNAVKFTPPGGQIEIVVRQTMGSLAVAIRDSGQGIAPEFLPYVFDRFRQADASTTRSKGGLGLGLAIVKHLVEMHGGSVAVESAGLGQGATFTVTLPVKPFTARIQPQPNEDRTATGALAGSKLLVVEDDPDSRELIEYVLAAEGARVRAVSSAEQALDALDTFEPDLVVSDIGMPGHDGYWLVEQLRKRRPTIQALALTAYARREDALRARRAGFDAHIGKPVDPSRLIQMIATIRR
jgi:PAS domain S-box-containing protein